MAVYEFTMPSLGADMEEGALIEWKVKPGDRVRRGDIVAVVDTAKAAIDVEIWTDGVVDSLLVPEDPERKIPVDTPLALLTVEEEETSESPSVPGRIPLSPAARRRARELGIDPAVLAARYGDRPLGLEDVEAFAAERSRAEEVREPTEAKGTREGFAGDRNRSMRRAIGQALSRSWREIPHYYLSLSADVTQLQERLLQENKTRSVAERLILAVYYVRAVALAAREVAGMNGFYRDGEFHPSEEVHVGMAFALRGGGLVAPAIHNADKKSSMELMAALMDLADRTASYTLRGSEITDATITVTSPGDPGVETLYGIIYPPQVALVGFGSVERKPLCVGEEILPGSVVNVSLSADHRVSDGRQGAKFLMYIKELLEDPRQLMGG